MRWSLPLLLVACSETGLSGGNATDVAASFGDFDDFSIALQRMDVEHSVFDGLISNATWTEQDLTNAAPVEDLLLNNEARLHGALWLTSGTRGLGATVYNRNEADDALLRDGAGIDTARAFVRSGKNILVSDWAYDLAEQAWPDAVTFAGDDGVFDAAQVGDIGTVIARVTDDRLVDSLGMEQVVLEYNFSNWAVITDVGPDTTVWLRGDVRAWNGTAYEALTDVPLLVSFEPEGRGSGRVVVMTFHGNAQPDALTDTVLSTVAGPLPLLDGR